MSVVWCVCLSISVCVVNLSRVVAQWTEVILAVSVCLTVCLSACLSVSLSEGYLSRVAAQCPEGTRGAVG